MRNSCKYGAHSIFNEFVVISVVIVIVTQYQNMQHMKICSSIPLEANDIKSKPISKFICIPLLKELSNSK